jgi:hypothetical protein
MGMDVMGVAPTSEVGAYFRRNVWGWHPLWDFCTDVSEVANEVEHGHSNDGDGLDAEGSIELANQIRSMIADGSAKEYIDARNLQLANLERPTCEYCDGTGIRSDDIGVQHGMPERELSPEMAILTGRTHGFCNGCSGEGKTDAWATNYSLDLDDLIQFADFLADCGGFQIC